jgi:uncharacterized circularly permuted ATP-grasp superfamily protein/uncharacterized alpha-E superfamily protein
VESLFPNPEDSQLHRPASSHALKVALAARAGHYDELHGRSEAADALAPHWEQFFDHMDDEGLSQLDRAAVAVEQQIRENGVTYNVYADTQDSARPWSLDVLPWIIPADEWTQIEAGVQQRASLLEAVMSDLYGPRKLLHHGLLPPALSIGSPAFVRAMQGVRPAGGYLYIAAFDLARGPDGRWWVVSQRTQAPSGLGYLLENRLTISRQFPSAFREMGIQHLASSYRALMDAIAQSNPLVKEFGTDAKTVLLTPGPYNETYFEQSYLARYLGIPLVEGGDLTVRNSRVWLKTIRGLEPVGAILRRLDDDFCDPLELRSDSALGVPGLMQAVRAGHVLLANALGSGFLESPAINGFLPAISEHLLGAPLTLPSLPSWWCGERAVIGEALEHLDGRVIKSTVGRGLEPVIGQMLKPAELAAWRARINAQPDAYTLQDFLPLSQLPVWQGSALVPRAAMLRVVALRRMSESASHVQRTSAWTVLPGGMARIAHSDQQIVSMQRGGSSADTWVMTKGAIDEFSLLPGAIRPEELGSRRRTVSSRAAENLFWLGRYSERTDTAVRLARLVLAELNDDDALPEELLDAITQLCIAAGLVEVQTPKATQSLALFERSLVDGLTATTRHAGIAHNLAALERAASQVRDRVAPDHWRLIVAARSEYLASRAEQPLHGSNADSLRILQQLSDEICAITGAQFDRMTRDDGWRLLSCGRLLERVAVQSHVLEIMLESGALAHATGYDLLIGLFDSTLTYRSLYQRRLELTAVVDLLVLDSANPRSLAYILGQLRTQLVRMPGMGLLENLPFEFPDPQQWDSVQLAQQSDQDALLDLVKDLRTSSYTMSDEISRKLFSHSQAWTSPW